MSEEEGCERREPQRDGSGEEGRGCRDSQAYREGLPNLEPELPKSLDVHSLAELGQLDVGVQQEGIKLKPWRRSASVSTRRTRSRDEASRLDFETSVLVPAGDLRLNRRVRSMRGDDEL